jgi:hypothetical protein
VTPAADGSRRLEAFVSPRPSLYHRADTWVRGHGDAIFTVAMILMMVTLVGGVSYVGATRPPPPPLSHLCNEDPRNLTEMRQRQCTLYFLQQQQGNRP